MAVDVGVAPRYAGSLPSGVLWLVSGWGKELGCCLVAGERVSRVRWITPVVVWEVAGGVDRADCLSTPVWVAVRP